MWVAKRPWCRRVDWYIWLRNVGKTELLVVIRSPSRTRLKVVDSFVCVCVGGFRFCDVIGMEECYWLE